MLLTKCLLPLTILFATSARPAQTATNKEPQPYVTVCEVLANRGFYDGKVVALIGRWSPTDEGFWLADDCENQVKTGGYVWSNIVVLEYDPSSASIFPKGPSLDFIAVNKKITELKARTKHTQDKLEWAVVYGRIETKEELPTAVAGDRKTIVPDGYGHLNAAPAQIVYREKDLVIVPGNPR
jgi:hypothetical protein